MPKMKWSESVLEGKLLAKMLRYASRIEKRLEKKLDDENLPDEDFEKAFSKYMILMRNISLAGKAKKDIARSTDWEQRLKELEQAKALTPEQLSILEKYPPDTLKSKVES